jgi:S1-C subfamily serine protease
MMRERLSALACFSAGMILLSLIVPGFSISALAKEGSSPVLRRQEDYILSLELEFSKKNQGSLERAFSLLNWGANGYATGFLVGNGIALTAYHVVSGDLSDNKRKLLGFKAQDQLNVKVYVNGCEATVIEVDKDADLALLSVCGSPRKVEPPKFQSSPSKDEQLLAIARLHGCKQVNRGILFGSYSFRGQEYWSAKFDMRDGYSGSPVYNQKAEVIGVFSGYDWNQSLAVISPAIRAEKLLQGYFAAPNNNRK